MVKIEGMPIVVDDYGNKVDITTTTSNLEKLSSIFRWNNYL